MLEVNEDGNPSASTLASCPEATAATVPPLVITTTVGVLETPTVLA